MDEFQTKAQGVISHFQDELKQIRTGRAQPALVEGVLVEVAAYGGAKMHLKELATISAPDSSMLMVQPFDPNIIRDIERAFHAANLGLSAVVDQGQIRISIPPLTMERRVQMTKLVAQKAEEAKIALRNLRSSAKENIEAQKELGGYSEDDIKRELEVLQKEVEKVNAEIDQLKEEKDKELMTV
jgi:ribosome recycling factor